MAEALREQEKTDIFAMDIGTRSIIGVVGRVENQRFHVLAIEKENHGQRTMLDGQIEDIEQVANVATTVLHRLEKQTRIHMSRVCVAAAGRALRSESATFRLELSSIQQISDEQIGQLESGAVSEAEHLLMDSEGKTPEQYYMVGYTVTSYRVDGYPMSSIKEHTGRVFEADVVATFLPQEVVESLYAVVNRMGLEVASLTLEPIASLNAAIPSDIRLLNLVLVDIGAGTSDIAICRDGSVVGYTMATVAGDEVTEQLMRTLLIDFKTGEDLKMSLGSDSKIPYTDILGIMHEITSDQIREIIEPTMTALSQEISHRVLDLNGRVPSAVFLAGGGSKLKGLREHVAQDMKIDGARVAIAGNHFERNAFSDDYNLNDPEYATPLGIAISAGLGLINDSYVVMLNGTPAKLFKSGSINLRDILLMNGYRYVDLMGRTGANLNITLNGTRQLYRGSLAVPPVIMINGKNAQFTDLVNAGDNITFVPAKPGADAQKTLSDILGKDFYGVVTVNGATASLGDSLHAGDEVWVDQLPRPQAPSQSQNPAQGQNPAQAAEPEKKEPGPPIHVTLNGEAREFPGKPNGEPYYLMDMLQYCDIDFDHLLKPIELRVNDQEGQFSQRLYDDDVVVIA